MYIQITTKCNMSCRHCAYSCGPRGRDMTREIFIKSLAVCENYGEIVAIGGGEPTIHPQFWEFIGLSLGADTEGPPWMATNGKITKTALVLARMARKGIIAVDLSLDPWHDKIDERVITAFTKGKKDHYLSGSNSEDYRGIRDITKSRDGVPVAQGRGRKNQYALGSIPGCVCEDIFINPLGDIFACGCQTRKFGTVDKPEIPDNYERGECGNKTRE